jgi:hypothetical protein
MADTQGAREGDYGFLFCPKNMSSDDYTYIKTPLNVVELNLKNMNNLSHRDFLGALMGLWY